MGKFEVFREGRGVSLKDSATIGLTANGKLSLNRKAFDMLHQPEAVELLFDREDQRVGIRAVEATVSHAYPVRKQSRADSYIIAASRFVNAYDLSEIRGRFVATWDCDVLAASITK